MIDGAKLAHLRYDRGLAQRKLAAAAGVDALTIKRLEDGADGGELPLRVVLRIAQALGVTVGDLLGEIQHRANDETEAVGAALIAHGPISVADLSETTELELSLVERAHDELAVRLKGTGVAVARQGRQAKLVPTITPKVRCHHPARELDVNQARLLRRIHRGEDVRRALSRTERELVLPSLLRSGLVEIVDGHVLLAVVAQQGLAADAVTQTASVGST
jgi:transcriptional regulator with XRE-family HTH domain